MFINTKTKRLSLTLTILSLMSIILVGQEYSYIFQYDRSAIMKGEYWRIATCHFVHMGWEHLFLNVIGVVILFHLFIHSYSLFVWLVGTLCCMTCIGLSFLVLYPRLEWYNGLSGLLHALLVLGIIGEIKTGNKFYYFGLMLLIGKLAMEYFAGPIDLTNQFAKAFVVTSAHLSGAITGGVTGCTIICIQKLLSDQSIRVSAQPAK